MWSASACPSGEKLFRAVFLAQDLDIDLLAAFHLSFALARFRRDSQSSTDNPSARKSPHPRPVLGVPAEEAETDNRLHSSLSTMAMRVAGRAFILLAAIFSRWRQDITNRNVDLFQIGTTWIGLIERARRVNGSTASEPRIKSILERDAQ
jgi:hypothetical protein